MRVLSGSEKCIIVCTCIGLGILAYFKSGNPAKPFDGVINVPLPNENAISYDIDFETSDISALGVSIDVEARKYSNLECREIFERSTDAILEKMLNGNSGTGEIVSDVDFYSELQDIPFRFIWSVEDPGIFNDEGKIICTEPHDTVISLSVNYESFYKDYSIPVHVNPGKEIIERVESEKIKAFIDEALNSMRGDAMTPETLNQIQLPEYVDGEKINYAFSEKRKNPFYLISGFVVAAAVLIGTKKDERKIEEERREEILKDYPVLLQKMSMYLFSGMTVRNIWTKLLEDAEAKGDEERPLYIEIQTAVNEIKSGVSEGTAYSRLAERTGVKEMVRFTTLLVQNLKKGSTKLCELLRRESSAAFEARTQRAKKAGEEASTKLLLPMMLLLIDVMLMIIVPAFWSV